MGYVLRSAVIERPAQSKQYRPARKLDVVSEDDHGGGSGDHGWDVFSPQPLAMPSASSTFNLLKPYFI